MASRVRAVATRAVSRSATGFAQAPVAALIVPAGRTFRAACVVREWGALDRAYLDEQGERMGIAHLQEKALEDGERL